MKSLLVVLLSLSLSACGFFQESFNDARTQVKLLVGDNGQCSAVVVAPGRVLTARHCQEIVNPTVDGKPAKILKVHPAADLLLMEADVACPCAKIDYTPEQDEYLIVVGFPFANWIDAIEVITEGRAEGVRRGEKLREEFGDTLVLTAPVGGGNSGGGVFIMRGGKWYLVGILVAANESTSLAVDIDTIKAFLQ